MKPISSTLWKNEQGTTLTELLITITILIFVLTILASFLKEGFATFDRTVTEAETQLEVRHKMEMLKQDIRLSKTGIVGGTTYPFADIPSKTLILYTGTNEQPSFITYVLEGNQLYKAVSGEVRTLFLSNVTEFNAVAETDANVVSIQAVISLATDYSLQTVNKPYSITVHPRGKIR